MNKKKSKNLFKISLFVKRNKWNIILVFIFLLHIFLRLYLLFQRANFGWDQIDSAWAAKNIIVDKHFIVNGPVAKGNSGIYVGPFYFYLISIFYFFTNLDPIASPIFQSTLSILNLLILFYVTKKIFSSQIALIASIINVFSVTVMNADRVQSAYYLIVPISYLIFYTLYKIICGEIKYIPLLAIFAGLSFHIDFTSVFYPILIFLSLPFFPRNRKTLKYILISIPIFILFFLPSILIEISTKHSTPNNLVYLFQTSYHGLHLRRVLQTVHDGFISFEQILQFRFFRPFIFLILPIFMAVYYMKNSKRQSLLLFYLISLWILVPWLVLSTYAGELTDYYFSLPRDIVIAILAYLTVVLFRRKGTLYKIIPAVFWAVYMVYGLQNFIDTPDGNLLSNENNVRQAIHSKKVINFTQGDPKSYIYYYYTRK